jgi:conjugal transfer pilus assembly protein TraV
MNKLLLTTTLLTVSFFQGCAVVGENDFACQGYPENPVCLSVTEAYEVTQGGYEGHYEEEMKEKGSSEEYQEENEEESGLLSRSIETKNLTSETINAKPVATYKKYPDVLPMAEFPVPIRQPAQVMRIWYGPWEDVNGDLNVGKTIYTEIVPRKWTIGEELVRGNAHIDPLKNN